MSTDSNDNVVALRKEDAIAYCRVISQSLWGYVDQDVHKHAAPAFRAYPSSRRDKTHMSVAESAQREAEGRGAIDEKEGEDSGHSIC